MTKADGRAGQIINQGYELVAVGFVSVEAIWRHLNFAAVIAFKP